MAIRYDSLWASLWFVFAVSCGGATSPGAAEPQVPPPAPAAATPSASGSGAEPAPTGAAQGASWDKLSRDDLMRIVKEGAAKRLREVEPSLELAKIAEYRARPETCPPLGGRATERLFDLALLDLMAGRIDDAIATVKLVRTRAKNRNLAFSGSTLLAESMRRKAGADPAAQEAAIVGVFREQPRARFGMATVVFQLFQTDDQVKARIADIHRQLIALETAAESLFFSEVIASIVKNRDRFLAAMQKVRAENDAKPPDKPFPISTVDLTGAKDAREVMVAVWDTGVATKLYEKQLFTNPHEKPNGKDDDGNGQVDDLSGLVADGNAPNTALLYDPGADTLVKYKGFLQGIMDLRAGLSSTPAAKRVLELTRGVKSADELDALETKLDAIGEWAHGTHVAGLMLAGAPTARLSVFRSAWIGEARSYHHRGPSDAELDAERRNMDAIADYVLRFKIRVMNASIGFSREYLEDELRREQARYPTDEAVRARARAVHAKRRANFEALFAKCPNTLFVFAAGNDNRDVVEYEDLVGAIDAPNLVIVGAVDKFGSWAIFTNSAPRRVRVFGLGVEAPSLIPSGEPVALSGTSMASPNVANLAVKLFALDPDLTPARAAQILVETGDAIAPPFEGRIANQKRAIERIRRERGKGPKK